MHKNDRLRVIERFFRADDYAHYERLTVLHRARGIPLEVYHENRYLVNRRGALRYALRQSSFSRAHGARGDLKCNKGGIPLQPQSF